MLGDLTLKPKHCHASLSWCLGVVVPTLLHLIQMGFLFVLFFFLRSALKTLMIVSDCAPLALNLKIYTETDSTPSLSLFVVVVGNLANAELGLFIRHD